METNKNLHCSFCNSPFVISNGHRLTVIRQIKSSENQTSLQKMMIQIPVCKHCDKQISPFIYYNFRLMLVLAIIAFICVLIGIVQKELFSQTVIGSICVLVVTVFGFAIFLIPWFWGISKIDDSFVIPIDKEPYAGISFIDFLVKNGFVTEKEEPRIIDIHDTGFMPLSMIKVVLKNRYNVEIVETDKDKDKGK